MTEVKVENPDSMERKEVDGDGRVYLGRDLSGEMVEIVVTVVDSQEDA